MSFDMTARLWQVHGLAPGTKLILMALADYANDEGVCWPSRRKIAAKCGLSVRTVASHLSTLVDLGLVEVTNQTRADGSYTSSRYHLFPPASGVGRESANVTLPEESLASGGEKVAYHEPVTGPIVNHGSGGGHPTPEEVEYIELRINQAIATRRIQTTPTQLRASLVKRAQEGTLDISTLPALREWAAAPPPPANRKSQTTHSKGYSAMRQDATVAAVTQWLASKKGGGSER